MIYAKEFNLPINNKTTLGYTENGEICIISCRATSKSITLNVNILDLDKNTGLTLSSTNILKFIAPE